MKKFLSLVLALVMTMSLVTVSAGAKDFGDSADLSGEAYEEAVNVMSEMGIIDGYSDGDFRPQGTLTRQAAAKIIACMMLGKTTAESLGTSAAPFKDVPAGSSFAGYIAFCVERGLISGYADGTFRPTGTLTGFAFLKMLLGALGYDQSIEGYTGTNWTVNVAGRAYEIGLTDGNDEFVGSKACTREEAALYAVNTLKATLVEYANKGSSITINGIEVVQGASEPTYITSSIAGAATSIDDTRDNYTGDYTVEFAERYQPDLELDPDTDPFGRPSHTWSWKGNEIGTYVDYSKMIAEYTTEVTYKDLYNELGRNVLTNYDVSAYIDGVDANAELAKISRSNTNTFGKTGNGVLTQVFVDPTAGRDGEAVVAVINTYLAVATNDYSEKNDSAPLEVWGIEKLANGEYQKDAGVGGDHTNSLKAYGEDFEVAKDIVDGDIVLVTVADKEIQSIADPEVVSEVSINSFKKTSWVVSEGTTYDYADSATYDDDVLDQYDKASNPNMKDTTYNLYLDQYGYMIGVEIVDSVDNYVFITGYEEFGSVLTSAKAEARAIFLDGSSTMITVKDAADTKSKYGNDWNSNGQPNENGWYTYTVDKNGEYSLEPVATSIITGEDVAQGQDKRDGQEINKSHVSLKVDSKNYVYGNDDTVYLGAKLNEAKTQITGVSSTVTGAKNVNMKLAVANGAPDGAYVLYDDDYYVIAAVVVGQNLAATENYAYILDADVHQEDYDVENDEWTWYRTAVVNGEEVILREKGDHADYIDDDAMKQDTWYIVEYDADGYVIGKTEVTYDYVSDLDSETDATGSVASFNTADATAASRGYDKEDVTLVRQEMTKGTNELVLQGLTVYVTRSLASDTGIAIVPGAKVVLVDDYADTGREVEYFDEGDGNNNVEAALDEMYSTKYNGYVYFVMEDGVATTIIIDDTDTHASENAPIVPGHSDKYEAVLHTSADGKGLTLDMKNVTIGQTFSWKLIATSIHTGGTGIVKDGTETVDANGVDYFKVLDAVDAGVSYSIEITIDGETFTVSR